MALDKISLKSSIKQAFNDQRSNTNDPDAALDDLAAKIADAVEVFVKSGTVNTTVETTGTAAAQTGTGTGNIT
ncbi:MAG: hypothetical protein JXR60_12290 [Bacteroidales bacterium]|nr:hypothetical protein [Bacteroidales bacterium]